MATRYRKDRNCWEVYWRDPATGNRRARKCKTQKEAEKEDRRIKYMLEFEREKLVEETKKDEKDAQDMSIVDAMRKAGVPQDKLSYIQRVIGNMVPEDFTLIAQRKIASAWKDRGMKGNTINRYFSEIRTGLNWMFEHGLIENLPERLKVKGNPSVVPAPPNAEEFSKLYEAASPKYRRILILGAKFGMRVGSSELLSLSWEDIDMERWVIHLKAARKNKAEPVRDIPIPPPYRNIFKDWMREDGGKGYLIRKKSGSPICRIQWKVFSELCKRAGVRKIRPYDLRHAFATDMVDAGVDLVTVAKLMGHSGINMLAKHYRHVSEDRKLNAMGMLVCPDCVSKKTDN